jgi:hypothetical protein
MTRMLLVVAVTTALVMAWVVAPVAPPVDVGPGLEPAAAAAAVCPVRLDRTVDGKVTIGSTVLAPARVTLGNAGVVATDRMVGVDDAGGAAIQFEDLVLGGFGGAFVEFEVAAAAAASVSRGDAGVAAVTCTSLHRTSSLIVGGSTRNGESLDLVLVNPYGSDAVVSVESSSEIGVDSADRLSSVVVPARSTVVRDLATVLPLRNRLSLTINPVRGLVHAFVEGGGRGDRLLIEQVHPGGEWILPVPRFEGQQTALVVASASPLEVAVRVDGWSDGEFVEGFESGTIPPRGQIEIPVGESDLDMVRVLADGPIAVSIVIDGEAGRAATPGNVTALPEWLMPGPGSAGSIAWVGAPGDADVVVDFLSLVSGDGSFRVEIPVGEMRAVPLDDQLVGYTLRADGPITVLWSVSDETGIGLGTPVPVPGGE